MVASCVTSLFASRPLRRLLRARPLSRRTVAATLFVLTRASSAFAQGEPSRVASSVTLNPGDAIRITVWRKPELSGEFAIAADGSIVHPLYKEVNVAGVALTAVEARLLEVISKIERAPFVVEPLLRVSVEGEVRQPSVYTLRPETSIAQAIALAGGPTERGRVDRVRVVRSDGEVTADLRRSDAGGSRMTIRSGDRIVVDRSRAVWRDVLSPVVTILGATAAVVSVILYQGNR